MNMRNVNIVARYESKLLRRDIVFLGFVVIALVGISLWQMIKQGRVNVFWYKVALPSSLDRKSTRLNSSHLSRSRMPSSA